MDDEETAEALIKVANSKMAGAIRLISIERGHDPKIFAAMPFGGGGALHAGALMQDIGLAAAVIPRSTTTSTTTQRRRSETRRAATSRSSSSEKREAADRKRGRCAWVCGMDTGLCEFAGHWVCGTQKLECAVEQRLGMSGRVCGDTGFAGTQLTRTTVM